MTNFYPDFTLCYQVDRWVFSGFPHLSQQNLVFPQSDELKQMQNLVLLRGSGCIHVGYVLSQEHDRFMFVFTETSECVKYFSVGHMHHSAHVVLNLDAHREIRVLNGCHLILCLSNGF